MGAKRYELDIFTKGRDSGIEDLNGWNLLCYEYVPTAYALAVEGMLTSTLLSSFDIYKKLFPKE